MLHQFQPCLWSSEKLQGCFLRNVEQYKDYPSSAAGKATKIVEVECSIRIDPAIVFTDSTGNFKVSCFSGLRKNDPFRF